MNRVVAELEPLSAETALDWLGEALLPEASSAPTQETDNAPQLSSAAELSWQELTLVNGSDGRPHLYVLTGGEPTSGYVTFKLRIRNSNRVYNMTRTVLKMRLSKQQADGNWRTVPLHGQTAGADYLVSRSEDIEDETAVTKSIRINRNILQGAYNPDQPLTRFEVEFHWYEGSRYYYNRNSITFYLVNAVEPLFSRGRRVQTISFNDPARHRSRFWHLVREKTFNRGDTSAVTVQATITSELSRSDSNEVSYSQSVTSSDSREQSSTVAASQSSTGKLGFTVENVVEAGIETNNSLSTSNTVTINHSDSRELSRGLTRNTTFSRSFTRSQQITWTLAAPDQLPAVRALYIYPIFDLWRLPVVFYGPANANGYATRRVQRERLPVMLFAGWGDITIAPPLPASSREQLDERADGWQLPGEETAIEQVALAETGGGSFARLRPEQVRFLAFEGGGGKGLAYVGAVRALECLGVLRFSGGRLDRSRISGISGASAGAITALMVSMGYDAAGIDALRRDTRQIHFNEFFDLPQSPRQIPALASANGCVAGSNDILLRQLITPISSFIAGQLDQLLPDLLQRTDARLSRSALQSTIQSLLNQQLQQSLISGISPRASASDKLGSTALIYYAQNLWQDFGFFSGCRARRFFDQLLAARLGRSSGNVTFREHFDAFGIKLVLAGTNLESGMSELFSVDTTPQMPVADAVRISMSLPLIYKPVRISAAQSQAITQGAVRPLSDRRGLAGLWVDGGLWNNLPIRAFLQEPGAHPATLGIKLGESGRVAIRSFTDFLSRYVVDFGLMGTGEVSHSHTSGYRQQMIELPTTGLETANFTPDEATLRARIDDAGKRVFSYFGRSHADWASCAGALITPP